MRNSALVVTCEHGGNEVPATYRSLFAGRKRLLRSHRGFDPGALALARLIARRQRAPLIAATVSRLIVELNRSLGHRELFSEVTRPLSRKDKDSILARHYYPFRRRVESTIRRGIRRKGTVIHLSIHTFTPVRCGKRRDCDVGLLYDPDRPGEVALCRRLATALRSLAPRWRVRNNYPYRGWSDGLTTTLRRRLGPRQYLGIEIEVNQRFARVGGPVWKTTSETIVEAVARAYRLGGHDGG